MPSAYDWNQEPSYSNPWKQERRVSMTLTYFLIIVFLTFVTAYVIGMLTHDLDPHEPVSPQTTVSVPVHNAQNYADWCGGYVQRVHGDITVQHCDR